MFQYPEAKTSSSLLMHAPSNVLKEKALDLLDQCHSLIALSSPSNSSLSSGRLGTAFYFYNSYQVFGKRQDADRVQQLLETVIADLNSGRSSLFNPSFAGGVAGLGYLLNYLSLKNFIGLSMETEFAEIDNYLFQNAVKQIEAGRNDWLHGAFGIIFYFLSRLPDPNIRQYLNVLLETVLTTSEIQSGRSMIKNLFAHNDPNRINLSLSHGQAGFLVILMQAIHHGFHKERLTHYVKAAISSILQFRDRYKRDSKSLFPFEVFLDQISQDIIANRLGWCYGDLNQLILLYEAAGTFSENRYSWLADQIGQSSIRRITEFDTMCFDSRFCHGSSGIAQTYRKLYSLGKLAAYQDAYLYWINKTIELLERDLRTELYVGRENGLLDGLAGPALILLSFATEEELDWSKCWLL